MPVRGVILPGTAGSTGQVLMSRTGRVIRVALAVGGLLMIAGIVIPLVARARLNSERINCQNHLKDIGLLGVRHASMPNRGLPEQPTDELPAGTIYSNTLPPDQRLSWYVSILNVLTTGLPQPEGAKKHRAPRGLGEILPVIDMNGAWDSEANAPVARFRLTTAICPSRVSDLQDGIDQPTNYLAIGGLGLDTPSLSREAAGWKAGAYRYDSPTPLDAFTDGLHQTAQFIETARDIGPWLRGGPSTLRGLDETDLPHVGNGRAFGGCHPGGVYVSLADGAVSFLRESIDPVVFRAMFTIAGGRNEQPFDAP